MRLEIERRCILFPLIILEMFLQLNWSSPVVNSIDWKLFGKAHTCLYKVPQLTVHVRAKTKTQNRRNCLEVQKFGTTKTLSRAGRPPKLSNLGRSALVRVDGHSDRALEFRCGDGRTFQNDNHLCSTPPIRPLW